MVTGGRPARVMTSASTFGVLLVAILLAVPGCQPAARSPRPSPPGPDSPAAVVLHDQAKTVLARWAAAVAAAGGRAGVVPVGDLTGQVGDWEAEVGDNNKRALMAGQVLTDAELSTVVPADGKVTWADGTTATVSVLSAQDALVAIGRSGSPDACGGCTPLMVTKTTLGSGAIDTTRGTARGPIWTLAIKGTAVTVTRVAIGNAVTVPRLEVGPGASAAMGIDAASGTVSGTALTVSFVGAPLPGNQPCGEDYSAEAVESDLAVTVIVTRHPFLGPVVACPAVGATRTAAATLAAPLGDRTVLDLQSGQPVTTTLTR